MTDWLSSLFSRVSLQGVSSRRLVSVTVGVVLLAWLRVSFLSDTVPDIPGSVIGLLALVVGTGAIKPEGAP